MMRHRRWLAGLALALTMVSCVGYEPQDIDLAQVAAETRALAGGRLSFADAVALALRQNPELHALEAAARAAGADVPASELQAEWRGDDRMLSIAVDPVALLRLGARGASASLADARGAEALAALAVARWRIVGEVAELFAAATALAELDAPYIDVDPTPFVQAGLASPIAAAQVGAATAGARAERSALDAERAAVVAELRVRVGLSPTTEIELLPVTGDFPNLPATDDATLLRRPDLALALARYQVADAEFRLAVAAQYPSLMLGPEIPLRGGALDAMALLRLPIGAGSSAVAAKERRTAARAEVVAAFLSASNAASTSERKHVAAHYRAEATAASALASDAALAAAKAALQVDIDAFGQLAEKAPMAIRDFMERREAAVAAAKARVQWAVAYGWPAAEVRE